MGNYPAHYAYPSSPPVVRILPNPVRLHWAWVLVLQILTRGLFAPIWLIVQANWVRKVRGSSKAFVWAIVYLVAFPTLIFSGVLLGIAGALLHMDTSAAGPLVAGYMLVLFLAIIVLNLGTIFTLRSELEELPIGLTLGAVMTFFFGTIYFQYHLRGFSFEQVNTSGTTLGLNAVPVVIPVEQDKSL